MKNVLCVDIGTTSLKAALISGNGDILSFSRKQLSKFCDVICNHEQSENQSATSQSWLPALASATKDIFANLEKSSIIKKSATMEESASDVHKSSFQEKLSSEVCAIAISGNGPTIVSEDGTTLLWNKATDFSDEATNLLKDTKIQTNTKNPSRSLFIPRLYAFKKLYASSWNLSHYIYSGPEYLIYKLTGKSVTILPEERYETAYWKSEDLERVSLEREKLPDFVPLGFCAGNTLPEITKQLSLSKPIPVFCTGPDFIAAMIGSNSFSDGKIYDRAGSSEGVNICTSTKIIKGGVRLLPSVISEKWNASVLSEESGKLFVHYKKIMDNLRKKDCSYAELIEENIALKAGSGFETLEFIANQFARSVKKLLDSAFDYGVKPLFPIIVTGGQANNPQWMQMKTSIAGVPLATTNCADAELIGNALVAFTSLKMYNSLEDAAQKICRITKVYNP